MQFTIYHNPNCGTSRNALAAIRAAGHEPKVREYLTMPLRREEIASLIALAGLIPRDAVRRKEKLFTELSLDARDVGGDELIDAMVENPILLNRPFVVVERGNGEIVAKLCRPSEMVRSLLGQTVQP